MHFHAVHFNDIVSVKRTASECRSLYLFPGIVPKYLINYCTKNNIQQA